MRFHHQLITDIGLKRHQNQDAGVARPDLGLFLIADGMGGHMGGETASGMVADIVPKFLEKIPPTKKALSDSIRAANQAIYQESLEDIELQGMGTTTTALLFHQQNLIIGHVGDSRCYFFRPGAIWQITKDHSLVQEKLRAGLITRAQLKTDKNKNVITRSVGFEEDVNVDLYEMQIVPGDVFLICSDGLTGQMEDRQIFTIVEKNLFQEGDLEEASKKLIEIANSNGGEDNTTVILIQVRPD